MTRCRCDGRYDGCEHPGRCPQPGGGQWSPYFCGPCDQRRMDHLDASFIQLQAVLDKRGQ